MALQVCNCFHELGTVPRRAWIPRSNHLACLDTYMIVTATLWVRYLEIFPYIGNDVQVVRERQSARSVDVLRASANDDY